MKILIAIPCLLKGGTEKQTLNTIRLIRSMGHDVSTMCYFENDPIMVREYQKSGSDVKLLSLSRKVKFYNLIKILCKEFKNEKPDIIHVQYLSPGLLSIISAKLAGVKTVVTTIHQPWTLKYHGIKAYLIFRISAFLSSCVVAVSKNVELTWFGKINSYSLIDNSLLTKKHFTIHNTVDEHCITEISKRVDSHEIRKSMSLNDSFVFAVISRLRNEKGIDVLIRAFSMFVRKEMNSFLLIVGDGSDRQQLESLVNSLGIESSVIFFGEQLWEDAIKYMVIADVVIVPSRFEGFGLTAAEAMLLEKTVIASNVNGLMELIEDGKTGLLFPNENVFALFDCMKKIYNNPTLSNELRKAGRCYVKNNFGYSVYADKMETLYSLFLNKKLND